MIDQKENNVTEKETNMEVFVDDGLLVKPKTGMDVADIRDGLYYELLKLRAIETFIFYDSEEGQNAMECRGMKEGVSLLLKSIGFAMEAGLRGLDSAVEAKVSTAVDNAKCPDPAMHSDYVRIPVYKDKGTGKKTNP
jgi:hypothetical protein